MPHRTILFFVFVLCTSFGMQLVAMKKEKPNIPKLNMQRVKRFQQLQRRGWEHEKKLKKELLEIAKLKKKLLKEVTQKKNIDDYRKKKTATFTTIILRKLKAGDLPYFQQRPKVLNTIKGGNFNTIVKQSIFYCLNNYNDQRERTAWQNPDHKTQNVKILLKLCKNNSFKTAFMSIAQKKNTNLRKLFDQTLLTYHVNRVPYAKKTKLPGIRSDLKRIVKYCNPNANDKLVTTAFRTYKIKEEVARSIMLANLFKTS